MSRTNTIETDMIRLKTISIADPATNSAVSTSILENYSGVIITTTTTGNSQTLQTPTVITDIKRFSVINNDSSTNSITVNGIALKPGDVKYFVWDGSAWTSELNSSLITTITSSATPTINTNTTSNVSITALATDITSMTTNLSGIPTNFQKLIFRIKDNGTARTIAWGTSFEAKGVALPTTTVINKVLTVGFIYDTVTSKWGCVASVQEV